MIGITAIFAFLGIMCGLIAGLWWGFSQSWLMGFMTSVGGAVAGGIVGCSAGFIYDDIPHRIDMFSKKHRVLGGISFGLFCLLWLVLIAAFAYAGFMFIRHKRHHV